jgi:adenine deaminase
MSQRLEKLIDQGTGREPADIALKNGSFFDLVTGELLASDIAICGERIVGTCGDYAGRTEIDISGRIVVPGFIDTHLHIESRWSPRTNSTAASCPMASPRPSAIRTRSPMCSARKASASSSTAR